MRLLRAGELPERVALEDDLIVESENLDAIRRLPRDAFEVIYLDPPFNTGKRRQLHRIGFADEHDDFLAFIEPRLREARALLAPEGTLYFHIDPRESHYCKVLLDRIFGREQFLNEIVWAYDYGGRTKSRWPAKHDTILVYVKDRGRYHFDSAEVDREPYMAPGLQTAARLERGKLPTDVWWHTIVHTSGRERTGYPTQKPEGIVRRMVAASSRPGGWCLDFFAGSGTLGAVAAALGRRYVLVDESPDAVAVMVARLGGADTDARGGTRTHMPRRAGAFKAPA